MGHDRLYHGMAQNKIQKSGLTLNDLMELIVDRNLSKINYIIGKYFGGEKCQKFCPIKGTSSQAIRIFQYLYKLEYLFVCFCIGGTFGLLISRQPGKRETCRQVAIDKCSSSPQTLLVLWK